MIRRVEKMMMMMILIIIIILIRIKLRKWNYVYDNEHVFDKIYIYWKKFIRGVKYYPYRLRDIRRNFAAKPEREDTRLTTNIKRRNLAALVYEHFVYISRFPRRLRRERIVQRACLHHGFANHRHFLPVHAM